MENFGFDQISSGISSLVSIAVYILTAIPLQKIANRKGLTGWLAWIPIVNLVLYIKIAQKPIWWIALLLIPIANIVFLVIIYINFFKNIGQSPAWTWAILFPALFPIPLWIAKSRQDEYIEYI
jgi:hypothetical protein